MAEQVLVVSGSLADHRERLERLRDQLHDALDVASPNMLPQLAGQYRATLVELSALPNAAGVVRKRDELAERRKNRGAVAAPAPVAAKRSGKRGG